MARFLTLLLLASPVLAQELTLEARASPYAGKWLTLHGPQHTQGELYQGDQHVPGAGPRNRMVNGGSAWVEAFADVPEAYALAQSARAFQKLGLATTWTGYCIAGVLGGVMTAAALSGSSSAFRTTPAIAGTFSLLGAFLSLEIVGLIANQIWPKRVEEAVRVYNSALNESLPEAQRFDLGS